MKNPRRLHLPPLLPEVATQIYAPAAVDDDVSFRFTRAMDRLRGWERDATAILHQAHPLHWERWSVVMMATWRLEQLKAGRLAKTRVLEFLSSISPERTAGSPGFRLRVYHHGILFLDGMVRAVVDLTLGRPIEKGKPFLELIEYATFLKGKLPKFGETALGRAALDDRDRLTDLIVSRRRERPSDSAAASGLFKHD